jgi:hypothetical protein
MLQGYLAFSHETYANALVSERDHFAGSILEPCLGYVHRTEFEMLCKRKGMKTLLFRQPVMNDAF